MKQASWLVPAVLLAIEGSQGFVVPSLTAHSSKYTQLYATVDQPTNSSGVTSTNPLHISPQVVEAAKRRLYESEGYEIYSRNLSPRKERAKVLSELEAVARPDSWPQKVLKYPGQLVQKVVSRPTQPGKLILLRCGESTFNANGTFTGWLDPDLTPRGVQQCQHTAAVLQAEGLEPDVVYTSRLKRSVKSAWVILEELQALYLPIYKTYRLNQRMYGALQGLSKEETSAQVGSAAVNAWRNSLKARPPPLPNTDPNHPLHDRRYADLSRDQIPSTESLLDCQERARPLWEHKIKRDIEQGKTVMVVAHRDALRGLIKSIDGIGDVEIEDVRVPTCIPFVYRFQKVKGGTNDGTLIPITPDPNSGLTQKHASATFLETPKSLKAAVTEQQDETPDDQHFSGNAPYRSKRAASLQNTLEKLRTTQNLVTPALVGKKNAEEDAVDLGAAKSDDKQDEDDDDNVKLTTSRFVTELQRWTDDPSEFEEYEYDEFSNDDEEDVPVNVVSIPSPMINNSGFGMSSMFKEGEPFVVLIRHGRTPHNNLGLFTGWEDPPLAEGGVEDARNAGRVLKRYADPQLTTLSSHTIDRMYRVT